MTERKPGETGRSSSREAKIGKATKNEFGTRFKALRNPDRMTQRELAAILGVSNSTISRIENGIRPPVMTEEFFQNMASVPGWTSEEIAKLKDIATSTGQLTRRISPPRFEDESVSNSIVLGGIIIDFRIRSVGDQFPREELPILGHMIGQEVTLFFKDFINRRNAVKRMTTGYPEHEVKPSDSTQRN